MDITQYTVKDIYTGKLIRSTTAKELSEWLTLSYATLTDGQKDMIDCLEESFEQESEYGIKWYGAACGLSIEPKKKRRKRS